MEERRMITPRQESAAGDQTPSLRKDTLSKRTTDTDGTLRDEPNG
jgi:hypothetical protein